MPFTYLETYAVFLYFKGINILIIITLNILKTLVNLMALTILNPDKLESDKKIESRKGNIDIRSIKFMGDIKKYKTFA